MLKVVELLVAFDAHFHLDRNVKAIGLPQGASFEDVLAGPAVESGKEVDLVGSCVSFCDPYTYPAGRSLLDLPEDMVVAVGLHPKHHIRHQKDEDDSFRKLKELSWLGRVTAIVEMGLDHIEPRRRWPEQMDLLERVLTLLRVRHTLVLHCRGMPGDTGTETYMLLLHLVRKNVPADQRIYFHCFSGDEYVLSQWFAAFPDLYLGFTCMVQSFSGPQIRAVKAVAADRIVLETEAPYFVGAGHRYSAPNQLYSVAEIIAPIRQIQVYVLLQASAENARRPFNQQ
ncbi:3'-5' ssDNA/RNA exonuclease TatD-like [Ylistrum balloti]|uniref:3'-5' ssDNA/RNA exonuclease TatD-like n=1 Tax=Ylistrum balloti TaxID=509963 RepID=UPI002905888F|nr:3'-5' ssDNA/RNA exonuclease TatD-like [Ylistrum balloti]